VKRQTRFVSDKPAKEIISKMESTAQSLGFRVETHKYKVFFNINESPLWPVRDLIQEKAYVYNILEGVPFIP